LIAVTLSLKLGKLHFTPLKYPPICTFASKVSNVTLYPPPPPQTFKLWQFGHFDLFFPKCPYHIFYFIFKKIQKNPKTKKRKKVKYVVGHFGKKKSQSGRIVTI
jgi:hypothetical protein